jgi:hypothetical protein
LTEPVATGLADRLPIDSFDWTDFVQPSVVFSLGQHRLRFILPGFFNLTELIQRSERFHASDPCMFDITDEDPLECIGAWSESPFEMFQCYTYRTRLDEVKWADGKSASDLQKREIRKKQKKQSEDSLSAFYRHNLYMIDVASFPVSIISGFGNSQQEKSPERTRRNGRAEADIRVVNCIG